MLPRTADFYRDQIDRGLCDDLVAAPKARAVLRDILGEIMLSPGWTSQGIKRTAERRVHPSISSQAGYMCSIPMTPAPDLQLIRYVDTEGRRTRLSLRPVQARDPQLK
jgi:hypothetical protein